eukprot:20644-Heterococcus_DN1.PRE.1
MAVLPWFAIAVVPLLFIYYKIQQYYRPVSRDLQRLDCLSRSPIFAHFSETLNGVATLRAFSKQQQCMQENTARIDDSNRAYYHLQVHVHTIVVCNRERAIHCWYCQTVAVLWYMPMQALLRRCDEHTIITVCNRWLQMLLEMLGSSVLLVCALLIVVSRDASWLPLTAGTAGLILTCKCAECCYVRHVAHSVADTQEVAANLTWCVRSGCSTESRITSAERVNKYAAIQPEATPINEKYRPPEHWPQYGAIEFKGVSLRYRSDLELVLKDVSLSIKGGEKIGIVGRTGSGKSSLMTALFRLVEPCSGTIYIDGIDVCKLGLRDLRSKISIIPQESVLFSGTLRYNLDPCGLYDDTQLWSVITAAHLNNFVSRSPGKLSYQVAESGDNMSAGQKQLLCLARAILQHNKILVTDEASSSIDTNTDNLIQQTVRREFADCTVLSIAHRLATIADSDRILVVQDGRVSEFDTFNKLANRVDSGSGSNTSTSTASNS